jgi:hypothetical protein
MSYTESLAIMCPICSSKSRLEAYGVLAPWVAQLIQKRYVTTSLRKCDRCSLKFFSYRYTDKDTRDLYGSYRSGKYYKLRHSWEPWFSPAENNAYDPILSQTIVQSRVDFMTKKLLEAGITKEFNSCVDFGGDLGQFFPPSVKGNKYLVDLSAQSGYKGGVRIVNSLYEIPEKIDLVINCMVLEHMSELGDSIAELASVLSKNGVIYIEIPLDSFKTSRFHRTILYKKYLSLVSRIKPLFILIDFTGSVSRQLWKRVPWFGIVKQSEHINYFDNSSVTRLCKEFNGNVVISDPDFKFKQGRFNLGRLAIVISKG